MCCCPVLKANETPWQSIEFLVTKTSWETVLCVYVIHFNIKRAEKSVLCSHVKTELALQYNLLIAVQTSFFPNPAGRNTSCSRRKALKAVIYCSFKTLTF